MALAMFPRATGGQGSNKEENTAGTRLHVNLTRTSVGEFGPRLGIRDPGDAYTLRAEGFPKNEKLQLWVLWGGLTTESATPLEVSVAENGDVNRHGTTSRLNLTLPAQPKGLTFLFGLRTPDGKVRHWARYTPNPIVARNGPCQVSAEVEKGFGEVYLLSGTGFRPKEELRITTTTRQIDESHESLGRARENGTWVGRVTLPGTKKGSLKAKVRISGSKCAVELEVERLKVPQKSIASP
jgi:hypothetical protein